MNQLGRVICLSLLLMNVALAQSQWRRVKLSSRVDRVQPWTGIVLWTDHDKNNTDAIQLEFQYCRYDDICNAPGKYDWTRFEALLDEVAGRGHQLIPRFYFVYPGRTTTVPRFIKRLSDYSENVGKSEGKKTSFADWSNGAFKEFVLEFYSAFAKRYDNDPRIAYLQTGFGLWSEYHIYSGPRKIGVTFPDKKFQEKFLKHLDEAFNHTPWMISIDAADSDYSPIEDTPALQKLKFVLFDDSFLCKSHAKVNAENWRTFGKNRWHTNPAGGEFSYYNSRDQKNALSETGPNGRSFEEMAADFGVTFMIGNDQPEYQEMNRIRAAGIYSGYRLRIKEFLTAAKKAKVTVSNEGIAPMYHDAFVTVDGIRAKESLKGLLPGQSQTFEVELNAAAKLLTITSDRLTEQQVIQFDANLK